MFACIHELQIKMERVASCPTYISRQQRVRAECAAFAIVVGSQDDQNILESDYDGKRPDD